MTTELAALRKRLENWETDDDPTETTLDIIRDCLALAERQQAEIEGLRKLARFGFGCLSSARGDDYLVGELDGGDLQDLAEKTGVLVPVKVTEACGENCACAEWDDFPQDCYRTPDDVSAAILAAGEKP